jgi:hypothetical protein
MTLGSNAYALLGLTALVAGLVAVLVFAMLRLAAAARATHQQLHGGGEMALLSSALEQAVARLKAQERATAARAEASEHLSGEIIASLTAGLLVVGMDREIRPAAACWSSTTWPRSTIITARSPNRCRR